MTITTVSEIARGVFQNQLQAMRTNLDGCILGKDPIHLHDLRVANRRTRAAQIIFKGLFQVDLIRKYKDEFHWIHDVTGEVRDLDVNLQHFPRYQKQILKMWRPYLEPLREMLLSKRESAQEKLIQILKSDRLIDNLDSWEEVLKSEILDNTKLALEPANEYGCRRIIKRYRQVRKKGAKLTKNTPAETFHSYRINVKKLRYLMEFFRQVVEVEGYGKLRLALKNVQDAFGAFQDAEVQATQLREFAYELYQESASADTMLALGQLLFWLEKKARQSKKNCLKQVGWITDDSTARAFQACFKYPVD